MEFYLIQTFTTAVRSALRGGTRLVQDTASAEEDAHSLSFLRGGFCTCRTARFSA